MTAATRNVSVWLGAMTTIVVPVAYPAVGQLLSQMARIVWLYFVTGARG